MKKYVITICLILVTALSISFFWHLKTAQAAFNPNDLIDDAIFDNSSAFGGPPGINNWLNTYFPNSCISTNNGFSSPQPTGYSPSTGFTYGANVSAGTVIYDAAYAYGINPEVILATLEKESSVVSGDASYHCQYINTAMGYGCLDDSSCPSDPATESGFSKQVVHAAWLFKFAEQRSMGNMGFDVQLGNFPNPGDDWNNSDDPQSCYSGPMTQGVFQICPGGSATYFDGQVTIDGTNVHLANGATAALYYYTPHLPGNENFDNIFTTWFGNLYSSPYVASAYAQSNYPDLNPGQQTSAFLEFQNEGSATWYDLDSIGSAPSGTYPVDLGTSNPINGSSPFSSGWPSNNRAALTFAAVYDSDGVTLSDNQHVALPGQIVEFTFPLTAPTNLTAGTYNQSFQPIAEGVGNGGFNNPGVGLEITVNPVPALTYVSQSASPTIYPTGSNVATLTLSNSGNTPLYDDNSIASAPSGTYPVHLATANPINRVSAFSADWPTDTRAALNFAAVYDSDGVTLAPNQNIAQPGDIIIFDINFVPPPEYAAGVYNEAFQPILEGTGNGYFPNMNISYNVTVSQTPVVEYSTPPGTVNVNANQEVTVPLSITNVGNSNLSSSTKLYTDNGSQFQDPSWASSSVILSSIGSTLTPSQSTTVNAILLAPNASTQIEPTLDLQFQNTGGSGIPSTTPLNLSTVVNAAQYLASPHSQSANVTFTYGQTSTNKIYYQNTGNQVWYDDSSLSSATTRDPYPVHLATTAPMNRNSAFSSGWPSPNRPALNFAAVYDSDGVTLATNQNEVLPGQIAEYQFQMTPSVSASPGVYDEHLQPVAEGTGDGAFNDPGTYFAVTLLAPTYVAGNVSQSPYPTIDDGQQAEAYVEYQNDGTAPWYDSNSISQAPSNAFPVHLATTAPMNRNSAFSSGWPSPNRPALNFAAVYDSDGVTLATNQNIAQPGQIVKFEFPFSVPMNQPGGVYDESFQPVAEGTGDGAFNNPGTFLAVSVPQPYQAGNISPGGSSSDPTLNDGQQAQVTLEYQNDGTNTWYDDDSIGGAPAGSYPIHLGTADPINRVSAFSSTWPSNTRAALTFTAVYDSDGVTLANNQHEVLPGEIAKYNFDVTVPSNQPAGSYNEYFQLIAEGTGDGAFNNTSSYISITVP